MNKVLVTGGAGFIGSHTVVELVDAGFEPVLVDNLVNSERTALEGIASIIDKQPIFYEGDCCDREFLRAVFNQHDIAGVIHFAAYKSVNESVEKPLKYYANNVGSLLALLEIMKEHSVSDLIFSSSCTVYGDPDEPMVSEDTPTKPHASPYGHTKQICENILREMDQEGIRNVLLRYFNPIGAHPSSRIGELPIGVPNNLVPFITQSAAGERGPLTVFGDDYDTPDGSCVRDFIHVVDLAKAHVMALQWLGRQEETSTEVFNLGTGRGTSVKELVDAFQGISGGALEYETGPRRPGDVPMIFADVTKAEAVMGWKTSLSMEDALRDAWNWQKRLSDIH